MFKATRVRCASCLYYFDFCAQPTSRLSVTTTLLTRESSSSIGLPESSRIYSGSTGNSEGVFFHRSLPKSCNYETSQYRPLKGDTRKIFFVLIFIVFIPSQKRRAAPYGECLPTRLSWRTRILGSLCPPPR